MESLGIEREKAWNWKKGRKILKLLQKAYQIELISIGK
jgi:hypothetical protein